MSASTASEQATIIVADSEAAAPAAESTQPAAAEVQAQAAPQPAPQAPVATPQGRENAFAITSFVLGIASIVSGWTFIAPIVGLVFGVLALRRNTTERTLALWGVWLNIAMLALTVLAIFAAVIFFGFALAVGLPDFAG